MKKTASDFQKKLNKRILLILMGIFIAVLLVSTIFYGYSYYICKGNNSYKDLENEVCLNDNSTENEVNSEDLNEVKYVEKIIEFEKFPFAIKLVGVNSEDGQSIFDKEIKVTEYADESEYDENVFEDYKDGWSDYLFYLPSIDHYYLQGPSDTVLIKILSYDELKEEYLSPHVESTQAGAKFTRLCTMYGDKVNEVDVSALDCISTYEYSEGEYISSDKRKSWLRSLDDENYLIYTSISAPAGSFVDSTKDLAIDDLTKIEIVNE